VNPDHPQASWRWTTIGAAGEVRLGRQRTPKDHDGDHMVPYLRVANVFENRIDLSDVKQMNFTPAEQQVYRLKHGDILLNEGQSPQWLGRPAMYRDELAPCFFQNTLIRFRAGPDVLPGWALLVFRAQMHARRYMKISKITTNIAHLGAERFAGVEFPIPPLDVQRRLVEALDLHESRLDAAVASLTRAKANVKRARASVLKAAVEGRLVPTEAEIARAEGREYEPASVLLERILAARKAAWAAGGGRGKYVEPVKPETEGLAGLPEGWCWASLEQMGSWSSGGTPSRARADYYDGDIPWVKTGELLDTDVRWADEHITQAGLDGSSAKVFPSGTLLVAMYGATIGMTGRLAVPAATNQACAALLPNTGNATVLPYLWKFIISQRAEFRKVGQGGAQPNISQTIIKAWPIALPPLPEQHRITTEVDRRLSVLDALDATLDTNLARCARLRQSILKRAFEGRLVPASEPQDPPAGSRP
jgi:restriction endonuclease S subunit